MSPTYCDLLIDVVKEWEWMFDLSKYKRYHVCYCNHWFLMKTIGDTKVYLN